MSRSTSPVRVNIMSDSDGEEMNSEHVLNDLSTKIVNDVLPPEKESDLAINKSTVVAEVEHDTEDISKKAQKTLENLKHEAGDIMNNLKDISNEVGSHENSPSNAVVEGLKDMALGAQEKADEVSEWAKEKVEEVKSSFKQHSDASKDEDNTVIGDLKEAAGKAQQKFEEVVAQSQKLIDEHDLSPTEDEHKNDESFKVERVIESPLKAETGVPNAEADPFSTIQDDAESKVHHFEKHGHESHESEYSFAQKDSAEASSDIRERRPSPDDITADGRNLSPHGEHLIVGEDDHKFHDEEHTESSPVHETSESKEEIPLETYEEPSPQKETTPPVLDEKNSGKEDITNVINPETTVAFDEHLGDGSEGFSQDIHISDAVEQALHEQSPVQIDVNEPLPPPNTDVPAPLIEDAPTQILIEDVDATHHIEDDHDLKVDITQEDQQEPPSPPQLASQEHSPQPKSDEIELLRTKRSVDDEAAPREPSPPVESDKEGTPASADIHVEKTESSLTEVKDTVVKESSPPSMVEHRKESPPPVPKITTKPPTPPSSPIEDKAEEDVIVPKIVAHETKEEKTTVTTSHPQPHHHVKPIDITPLPEDEPIPVGIPEVRTTETVKEEKEKTTTSKKDQKGSSSSEDDKEKHGTRRQEGGIVGAVRRRCCIL